MNKILSNPFYVYILIFSSCIGLYFLRWSDLFIPLKVNLLFFFLISFITCFFVGKIVEKKVCPLKMREYVNRANIIIGSKMFFVNIIISISFLAEIIYFGKFPLLSVINGNYDFNIDHTSFGIPTFHVFAVTFSSFYSTWLFQIYLATKNKKALIYFFVIICWFALSFNRGIILMIATSCFFLYSFKNKITLKIFVRAIALVLVLLYLFGLAGEFRMSNLLGEKANEFILDLGGANENFYKSKVPNSFFWAYTYLCSPFANLQETINSSTNIDYGFSRIFEFISSEFLPDFISKRIFELIGSKQLVMSQVNESFNVGGIFARPFTYLGWTGLVSMLIYLIFFIFGYLSILDIQNKYYATAISILCTIMVFNVFQNMIWFSGLSFQLFYPLLFSFLNKFNLFKNKF